MTAMPKTLAGDLLAVEALNLMENHKITMLPITDAAGYPIGMLHMHDLIQAGVI
jgi:arabinose-5-phosphate isomerase